MLTAASSYPVLWSESDGQPATGRLTARCDALELEGSRNGSHLRRTFAYGELAGVHIGRRRAERLKGGSTIVVERRDARPLLVRPLGAGLLHEIADLLAELCARGGPVERLAVVLPLRPGTRETVQALLGEGPPFDPVDVSLDRHEVILDEHEAIFVFSGADVCESVRRILQEASVVRVAGRWSDCLAGPPRLAEFGYRWSQPVDLDPARATSSADG